MKLIIYRLNSNYLLLCLLFFLVFQKLNAAKVNDDKKTNSVIDLEFLKNINALKSQMIKEGSEFKDIALKFISKTNRYVIADENIKVKILILFFKITNSYKIVLFE